MRPIACVFVTLIFLEEIVVGTTIPPEVKDIVAFIFLSGDKGQPVPNGTGFFVVVKNDTNPGPNMFCRTVQGSIINRFGFDSTNCRAGLNSPAWISKSAVRVGFTLILSIKLWT